jgi:hypothetical protein
MRGFPMGFLSGFLVTQKVSCFACGKPHTEFRKLSTETLVNSGGERFPPLETVSTRGNPKFPMGFLEGFL